MQLCHHKHIKASSNRQHRMHTHTLPRATCMHGQLSSRRRWRLLQSPAKGRPDQLHDVRRKLRCRAELAETLEVSAAPEAQLDRLDNIATADGQNEAATIPSRPPTADAWQLDFCSRPILDERGKKVWELLICDETRTFEYSRYFPNNKINSTQLKAALAEILEQPGAAKPERVRFFRGQMQTIITRAVTDLGMKPVPSRRCFTLISWLRDRLETVYRQHPGFDPKAQTAFSLDLGAPAELPDSLRGEAWQFVQLPLSTLVAELEDVRRGKVFGEAFGLDLVGLSDLSDDTAIPGVAVFSRRSMPLAAWTSGVELAAVVADAERACLVLETGVNERFRYGRYRRTPESTAEAQAWEDAKRGVKGLHFLVIQADEDAEESAGIWLLQDQVVPIF